MKRDESQPVDYREALPEDLDEETHALLKLARTYTEAKRLVASQEDITQRSKEKGIPNYQARRELLDESKSEREQFVDEAKKIIKKRMSKDTKQKLGIKDVGRPEGSKNITEKMSRSDFYKKLEYLAKSKNRVGEELTQAEAAKALGLGGTRQLRRKFEDYSDERKWKDVVANLLA